MSEQQNHNPFEQFDSALADALGTYDRDKVELYDHLKRIIGATDNSEGDDPSMTAAYINTVSRSFAMAILALQHNSNDIDETKAQLVQLWLIDDRERVDLFRELTDTGDREFTYLGTDLCIEQVDEIYRTATNEQELMQEIGRRYRGFANFDLEILLVQMGIVARASRGDEYGEELIEVGPALKELVDTLEEVAGRCSQDYKEGYEDGCSISKTFTDIGRTACK